MKAATPRLRFLSGVGLCTAAFLLASQAATASTVHSNSPATHMSTPAQPSGHQPAGKGKDAPVAVYPRLSLPGCSRQDGFNGNVQVGEGYPPFYIKAWGEAWDLCGTDATVWLSWDSPGYVNRQIGSSGYDYTSGVNWGPQATFSLATNVWITVCAWWQSRWRCGTPYPAGGNPVKPS